MAQSHGDFFGLGSKNESLLLRKQILQLHQDLLSTCSEYLSEIGTVKNSKKMFNKSTPLVCPRLQKEMHQNLAWSACYI